MSGFETGLENSCVLNVELSAKGAVHTNLTAQNGGAGVIISGAEIDENGRLIITLSNGRVIDCGRVEGQDGVGIASIDFWMVVNRDTLEEQYHIVFEMSDGSTISKVLNVPKGPQGKPGKSAYDFAREGGYTGTEEEFTAALGSLGTEEDDPDFDVVDKGTLPGVTDADDGKVLTVVDGKWQAAELPKYEGEYVVTPATEDQELLTAQTYMAANLKVEKIPYAEVTNALGGVTATIG